MALKSWIAAALAVACMLFASAQLATAQQAQCMPRDVVKQNLNETYGETRRSGGLARGTIVETWGNDETGSWTITITRPDGMSCIAAVGQAFREYSEAIPQGEPS